MWRAREVDRIRAQELPVERPAFLPAYQSFSPQRARRVREGREELGGSGKNETTKDTKGHEGTRTSEADTRSEMHDQARAEPAPALAFYFLRCRILMSMLTTPFWSRVPTTEMFRRM